MRRALRTLALSGALGSLIAAALPAAAQDPSNDFQYLYGSAEAAALSRQTFQMVVGYALARKADRDAGRPLTQRVLADGSTLVRPLFESCGDKPLAAVFDVDETLLLNIGFEVWDATRPDRTAPWPEGVWEEWERTGFRKVAPVPGAMEAVAALRAAGIAVIYNTNRNTETADFTARALDFAGFGRPTPGIDLFTDTAGDSKKDGRRAEIARTYCVILLGGDQLGDISDLFNSGLAVPARREAAQAPVLAQLWGEGWFLLPNPVYGPSTRGTVDETFPDRDLRWTYPGEATP